MERKKQTMRTRENTKERENSKRMKKKKKNNGRNLLFSARKIWYRFLIKTMKATNKL